MRIKTTTYRLIAFCSLIIEMVAASAQEVNKEYKRTFGVSLEGIMFNRIKKNHTGEHSDWLKTRPAPIANFSFLFTQRVKSDWELLVNLGFTAIPTWIRTSYLPEVGSPVYEMWKRENFEIEESTGQFYFTDPLVFSYSLMLKRSFPAKNFAHRFIAAGFHVMDNKYGHNYIISGFEIQSGVSSNDKFQTISLGYHDINQRRFFPCFKFSFGYEKFLKTLNILSISIVGNIGFRQIGKGYYQFTNIGADDFGTLTLGTSYFGFCIAHQYTGLLKKNQQPRQKKE